MHFFSRSTVAVSFACAFVVALASSARGEDWPGWMGQNRDGVYAETGIVDAIPNDGLPVKWRVGIEGGYAGPAVVGGRVYVMDYRRTAGELVEAPDKKPELEGFERVLCIDAETGRELWKHEYACSYKISYPAGPRATVTVDGGYVYCLGAQGDFTVLSADDGSVLWSVDIVEKFGAPVPVWGFAAHPLVTEDMVITMVGGEGQSVVAFERKTGQVKWKSLSSNDAGYCPPSIIEAGGVKQLIVWHPTAVASLDPSTGKPYWEVPLEPDYGMSISHPQRYEEYLFVSGIVNKSLMLQLDDAKPEVTELWAGTPKTSIGVSTMTPIIHKGIIFGCDEDLGALVAAKVEDGTRLWNSYVPVRPGTERRISAGTAYVTRHAPSGNYLLFGESGHFTIAKMDESGFQSKGQMHVLEPTQSAFGRKVIWSHPAYSGKTAFFRNDKELVAIDLAKE